MPKTLALGITCLFAAGLVYFALTQKKGENLMPIIGTAHGAVIFGLVYRRQRRLDKARQLQEEQKET